MYDRPELDQKLGNKEKAMEYYRKAASTTAPQIRPCWPMPGRLRHERSSGAESSRAFARTAVLSYRNGIGHHQLEGVCAWVDSLPGTQVSWKGLRVNLLLLRYRLV